MDPFTRVSWLRLFWKYVLPTVAICCVDLMVFDMGSRMMRTPEYFWYGVALRLIAAWGGALAILWVIGLDRVGSAE